MKKALKGLSASFGQSAVTVSVIFTLISVGMLVAGGFADNDTNQALWVIAGLSFMAAAIGIRFALNFAGAVLLVMSELFSDPTPKAADFEKHAQEALDLAENRMEQSFGKGPDSRPIVWDESSGVPVPKFAPGYAADHTEG